MNYIVSKFRYIVYPAAGPTPPSGEEIMEKIKIEKQERDKKKLAIEKESKERKRWFGMF